MAKTIDDVLQRIKGYAEKYALSASDLEEIFNEGCSNCGGVEFLPIKKTESTGPPFIVNVDMIRSKPISIN